MNTEESVVLNFLEESPETWYSRREVARKAVHRSEYEENPNWASPIISSLLSRGLIEENNSGAIKYKKRQF